MLDPVGSFSDFYWWPWIEILEIYVYKPPERTDLSA